MTLTPINVGTEKVSDRKVVEMTLSLWGKT